MVHLTEEDTMSASSSSEHINGSHQMNGHDSDDSMETLKKQNGVADMTTVAPPSGTESKCPFSRSRPMKYLLEEGKVFHDTLHHKAVESIGCTNSTCTGSQLQPLPHRPPGTVRPKEELISQAKEFIDEFYTVNKKPGSLEHQQRVQEVLDSIENTGTYHITTEELTFGAKTAWRNASRCIGRIQWSKLQMFDCRHVSTAREMFTAVCEHLRYANNGGAIRSAITVFPQRTDGHHDFKVWNVQLVSYAAYRQPDGTIRGDKLRLEFTELCEKLGWRGKGGDFDVLPLVLQANGEDPEWFEIPQDLLMEVELQHPDYPWFAELGLRWYALPAVANMMFDCGGIEFTGSPFNGWYMGTEIGARDFCDSNRYDLAEPVAKKMGLNTGNPASLWKDKVMLTFNEAVLYSFQVARVTIMDHHSAAESFLQHYENEMRLRGGCPTDWVWVVPPISGSLSQVFHLEMLNYKLKPSYEYQVEPWKEHKWQDPELLALIGNPREDSGHRYSFKAVALGVLLTTRLMRLALSKRVKCTILYATETGRSEKFANTLAKMFKKKLDVKVECMESYDAQELKRETLVFVVASTFGNGDPPENGTSFAKSVDDMVSQQKRGGGMSNGLQNHATNKGPLSRVRYSVFGLGCSSYPNFCAFGRQMDVAFSTLGAERIHEKGEGDELHGQDHSFNEWAQGVFKAAIHSFRLGDSSTMDAVPETTAVQDPAQYRIVPVVGQEQPGLCEALSKIHKKQIVPTKMLKHSKLQSSSSDRSTILVQLDTGGEEEGLQYEAGDHVAVFPANQPPQVAAVMRRLTGAPPAQQLVKLELLKEDEEDSETRSWVADKRLPGVFSMETALKYYLDLHSCPEPGLLEQIALTATSDADRQALMYLAKDFGAYDKWKHDSVPTLADVLERFPSVTVSARLLLSQLPILQQRYYSISSDPAVCPGQVHVTLAVVKYQTQDGSTRHGVCSAWLNSIKPGHLVPAVIRQASLFHLPVSRSVPIILVGVGSGIAPFRSFWQHITREAETKGTANMVPLTFYFGCRQSTKDFLYKGELKKAVKKGIMEKTHLALSREPGKPKTYVQDLLLTNGRKVSRQVLTLGGHLYVCGDVTMAQNVADTVVKILCNHGNLNKQQATAYVQHMKKVNRYHEDIFGVRYQPTPVQK